MNIYIITVTLGTNDELDFEPECCEVDRDGAKSLILWVLGESLKGCKFNDLTGNDKGFEFNVTAPSRIFKQRNIDKKNKKYISIEDHHLMGNAGDSYPYTMRVSDGARIYGTAPLASPLQTCSQNLRGKNPVIINK
jgi:hypothetical protein